MCAALVDAMHKHSLIALVGFACAACGGGADDPLGSESQGAGASSSTEFHATETFDPFNVLGSGAAGGFVLSPAPEISCPGHTPTGALPPLSPCPEGSRIKIRGSHLLVVVQLEESPGATGVLAIEANANLDATGSGRQWGTFRVESSTGALAGVFGGTWEGDRTLIEEGCPNTTLPCYAEHVKTVGRGIEGSVTGAQFRGDAEITSYGLSVIAYTGTEVAKVFMP